MDARHGLLQKLSWQALCLWSHTNAFVAIARTPRSSRHLHLQQRRRSGHRLQSQFPTQQPFLTRLQFVSDVCRWKRRDASDHVVYSGGVEGDAKEGGGCWVKEISDFGLRDFE